VSDFDGVTFHISTPESKSKILVSLHIKCYQELVQYGAQSVLEREYGAYIVEPESGYDFSVLVDLENLPEDQGTANESGTWVVLTICRGQGRSGSARVPSQAKRHGCTLRTSV
jgi:hypothetical protein